jgi:hypothetical protein
MKRVLAWMVALAVVALSGCAVYTPSGGAVIVDPNGTVNRPAPASNGGHGGGFCPPGQAKKGNC